MTAAEVLTGGGIILVAMTLIQIAPIKLDPWSAIARAVGRATPRAWTSRSMATNF